MRKRNPVKTVLERTYSQNHVRHTYYIKDVSRWAKWEEDYHEDILEEGCLQDLVNSAYADCEVAFVDYQWNISKYAIMIES